MPEPENRLPGRFFRAESGKEAAPVIRGNMHRAIVLKAPDDTFSQALFILREDFPGREGVSRKELLRQANSAAAMYFPARRRRSVALAPAAIFLLGAASAILALWALGLL